MFQCTHRFLVKTLNNKENWILKIFLKFVDLLGREVCDIAWYKRYLYIIYNMAINIISFYFKVNFKTITIYYFCFIFKIISSKKYQIYLYRNDTDQKWWMVYRKFRFVSLDSKSVIKINKLRSNVSDE